MKPIQRLQRMIKYGFRGLYLPDSVLMEREAKEVVKEIEELTKDLRFQKQFVKDSDEKEALIRNICTVVLGAITEDTVQSRLDAKNILSELLVKGKNDE